MAARETSGGSTQLEPGGRASAVRAIGGGTGLLGALETIGRLTKVIAMAPTWRLNFASSNVSASAIWKWPMPSQGQKVSADSSQPDNRIRAFGAILRMAVTTRRLRSWPGVRDVPSQHGLVAPWRRVVAS